MPFFILLILSSCGFLYEPTQIIDKEKKSEFLNRLIKKYGNNYVYYFISSHKSLIKTDSDRRNYRDQISEQVVMKIKENGICGEFEPVLDRTGSWFNERGDIYINFFCKPELKTNRTENQ